MKPADIHRSMYIDLGPKCKIGNIVRIPKYKNNFVKGYVAILWTYVIGDLKDEDIFWTFYKKEMWKTN